VVYKDQFNSFRLGLTSSISTSGAAFPTVNDLESLSIQIISWRSEENGGGGGDVRMFERGVVHPGGDVEVGRSS
jgi:hypothetical protein